MPPTVLLLFNTVLGILSILYFHMKLDTFFDFHEESCWNFNAGCVKTVDCFYYLYFAYYISQ